MRTLWLVIAVTISTVTADGVFGQTPGEIGQQGILTDSLGNPIASGTFDLTFRLYAEEEGGSELWSETQTVTVDGGLYSVQLGSESPLTLPFDQQYWLGISIDEGEELAPRLRLSAAPYARRATTVDSVGTSTILPGAVTTDRIADGAVASSKLADGSVRLSKINSVGTQAGQVLASNGGGLGWSFIEDSSIPDRSILSRKISTSGGATGQVLTVGGDTVGWADPEEVTGAALPNKSVRAAKLNSQDAAAGQVMLAAGADSVVWDQIGAEGIGDGAVTPAKLSSEGGSVGSAIVRTEDGPAWGQVGTQGLADNAVTAAKISASGAATGQILTVEGENAEWRDPAGIGEASINYDRISTNGGAPGDFLGVAAGDTAGWLPLSVETSNLVDRAVTSAKMSPEGGQAGEVLSWNQQGVEWATPVVDPASFVAGSIGLDKLQTNGASNGDQLVYNGTVAEWQDVPALPLPFFGESGPADPLSFQISNPISFTGEDPVEEAYAVHGLMSSTVGGPLASGIRGENRAESAFGIGVWGSHAGGGWGVYGTTPSGLAIYGSSLDGHAGFFDGKVTIIGTLQKSAGSFTIDHPLDPENKTLSHSFVESPDMMNIYNGNVTLDAVGTATVTLPEWFDALNRDFRYQLTAIGAPGPNLHVAEEISGNTFRIAGGTPGMRVSWQVTGIRDDAYARTNPIIVEENKPADERGLYLNPEAFGLSRDRGAAPAQLEGLER